MQRGVLEPTTKYELTFSKMTKTACPFLFFFFGTLFAGLQGNLISKRSLPKIRSHSSPKTSCDLTASHDLLVLALNGEMPCLTGQKLPEDKAKGKGHLIV